MHEHLNYSAKKFEFHSSNLPEVGASPHKESAKLQREQNLMGIDSRPPNVYGRGSEWRDLTFEWNNALIMESDES